MKVPNFKTEKIRKDIFGLVDIIPTRSMYEIVLRSIDHAMQDLADVREEIPATAANKSELAKYDKHFTESGEREAYYYQAFLEADDRDIVDKPLFQGDYSGFEFDGPGWPDIETPWRMANELSTAAAKGGMGQDFLDDLQRRFKNTITEFWTEATRLILALKAEAEANTPEDQQSNQDSNGGRVYGFWPVIALGGAALIGALSTAAGYSSSKSKSPEEYVVDSWWGKHKKSAKNLGLGALAGVAVTALLVLRRR